MSSKIIVELLGNNLVPSFSEDLSNSIAAVYGHTYSGESGSTLTIFSEFAIGSELSDGYFRVSDASDWVKRYVSKFAGVSGEDQVLSPNPSNTLPICRAKGDSGCFLGANGNLATHWWSIHNYLTYGGSCLVAGGYTGFNSTNTPLLDKSVLNDIDVIFALDHGITQATIVRELVAGRGNDCFGIVGVSGSLSGFGEPVPGNTFLGQTAGLMEPRGASLGKYGMAIYGSKQHSGIDPNDTTTLVSTPLMADAAGCLARVDNDRYPWVSPAGMRRGQILNTVRLKEQPSDAVQTHLLSKKINFATTIPTQGTYLFSDRTLDEDTSPYRNINISRLLIYLIKNITPIANQYLFEINNERTRTSFVNAITPIFTTIQSTNGIETYKIVCDRSNNPDSVVRDNKFVVDVTIRPVNYIDTITIRFTNLDEV